MTDDNVIRPKFEEVHLRIRNKSIRKCMHSCVDVDDSARIVYCRECDAVLDPTQVLIEFAYGERRLQNFGATLRDMRMQIDELKKEERRIKARIRTASKKLVTYVIKDPDSLRPQTTPRQRVTDKE